MAKRFSFFLFFFQLGWMFLQAGGPGFPPQDKRILILEHVNTKETLVIPDGAEVRIKLESGPVISGNIDGFTQDGIKINGEVIPLQAIRKIKYQSPEKKTNRVLGKIGTFGGILGILGGLGLAIAFWLGAENAGDWLEALLFIIALLIIPPIVLLASIFVFFVGLTPGRQDWYHLKKWYRSSIKDLSGE